MRLPTVTPASLRALGATVTEENGLYTIKAGGELIRTRDLSSLTWRNLDAIQCAVQRRWAQRDRIMA